MKYSLLSKLQISADNLKSFFRPRENWGIPRDNNVLYFYHIFYFFRKISNLLLDDVICIVKILLVFYTYLTRGAVKSGKKRVLSISKRFYIVLCS